MTEWRARICRGRGSAVVLALLALAVGCRHDRIVAPLDEAWMIAVAAGNLQSVPAGSRLPQALGVRVVTTIGAPVKGARVVFRLERGAAGGSRLLDSVSVTGIDGVARVDLDLGAAFDTTVVIAAASLAPHQSASMRAYATAAPSLRSVAPQLFAAGDTVQLRGSGLGIAAGGAVAFGDVRVTVLAGASDTLVRVVAPACLADGAVSLRVANGSVRSNAVDATYLVVSAPAAIPTFTAITVRGSDVASCLRFGGQGAAYLVVPQFAAIGATTNPIDWRIGSSGTNPVAAAGDASVRAAADNPLRREFEALLRANERAIAPAVRAEAVARAPVVYREGGAVAPAVGGVRAFTVVSQIDGSGFATVGAKLRYVGEHLLLYVDTTGQGFTYDQYAKLGTLFDRDLYPLDVATFGSESDVDHDGRILVLFTPVVNAMSKASECGQKGFVTGFFYGNDLLLRNANSNKAEIFYSFIPDSTGRYSCAHTTDYVLRTLPGTFLHELQHMISFNQHVLARAGDTEASWLNEGLSHYAEELGSRYYEAKFPAPSGRTSADQIFPDSAGGFITPQLLNAYVYLNGTRAHSVTTYDGGGSIEDRGATWLFLRWLAEQKGEDVIGRLVQTSKTSIANVEEKAGEPFGALFGDFSVALYADSLVGVPRSRVSGRYEFGATRNLRRMMARLAIVSGFGQPWPLSLLSLRVGGSLQTAMPQGTMQHTLVQTKTADLGFSLRFTKLDDSPFTGSEGAQVSIFRLTP